MNIVFNIKILKINIALFLSSFLLNIFKIKPQF